MPLITRRLRNAVFGLCLLTAACSALVPPESCGPGTDGPPDEDRYAQAFRSMELVSAATGLPGEQDKDGNPSFIAGDDLQIFTDNARALNIRACVQELRSSSKIASEREGALPVGHAIIPLGSFDKGNYVARVLVDRVLVRNIVFSVQEGEN